MIGKPFINDALSRAIELYLKYKDKPEDPIFQSFLVVAIRTLIFIYGELDIINPYITQNEHNMGGFDSNLIKFGFPRKKLDDFKQQFIFFVQEEAKGTRPNLAFLKIEKYFIDMFFYKVKSLNLASNDYQKFYEYLYFSNNSNPIMQKDLERFVINKEELQLYFQSREYETKHSFTLEMVKRDILLPEAYQLLGYTMEQISLLNDQDLRAINQQIYQFFRVDATSPQKSLFLEKAVNYYKRYGNRITSGNGYVDFLLFSSVAATLVFLVSLFVFYYL